MLSRSKIISLFKKLNSALKERGQIGEVLVVGGAVMCLVYKARESTKDVDAVFEPASIIRKLAETIAYEEDIPPDWLNDSAKAFLQPDFFKEEVMSLSNLRVFAPEPKYLLAMKCISARWDTHDKDDVIFLIKHLEIKDSNSVIDIVSKYYPDNLIPAETKFFIEELFLRNLPIC